jgi:hypothetical protein
MPACAVRAVCVHRVQCECSAPRGCPQAAAGGTASYSVRIEQLTGLLARSCAAHPRQRQVVQRHDPAAGQAVARLAPVQLRPRRQAVSRCRSPAWRAALPPITCRGRSPTSRPPAHPPARPPATRHPHAATSPSARPPTTTCPRCGPTRTPRAASPRSSPMRPSSGCSPTEQTPSSSPRVGLQLRPLLGQAGAAAAPRRRPSWPARPRWPLHTHAALRRRGASVLRLPHPLHPHPRRAQHRGLGLPPRHEADVLQ